VIVVPFFAMVLLAFSTGPGGQATTEGATASGTAGSTAGNFRVLDPTASPIKEALREGKYPWYDPDADRVQPVWPARLAWLKWLSKRLQSFYDRVVKFFDRFKLGRGRGISISGDLIGTLVLMAALVVFFVSLMVLWIRREGGLARGESVRGRLGTSARLGELPEGIRPGDGDPWAEAVRRRAAGDRAGAVVCLFAHQLLSLDQLGLIRLAPGRTGRHYVQALRDQELGDSLGATLRLFEDVYYGCRFPTVQAFESVWNRALMFQERRRVLSAGDLR
jgi:hypothetical protein